MGRPQSTASRRLDAGTGRLLEGTGRGGQLALNGAAATSVRAVPPMIKRGSATGTRWPGRAASRPAVEVSHLRKTYGALVAVDDVSFWVAEGEIFGILGPRTSASPPGRSQEASR
jgi:hypothetical protein